MINRSFRSNALIRVFAAGLGVLGLAACTVVEQPAPRPIYQPPPLRVEIIPSPPQGSYVWQPGHWDWAGGNNYRWDPGRYVYRQAGYHQK